MAYYIYSRALNIIKSPIIARALNVYVSNVKVDPLQRNIEEALIIVISNVVFLSLIIGLFLPITQKSKIISKTFITITKLKFPSSSSLIMICF